MTRATHCRPDLNCQVHWKPTQGPTVQVETPTVPCTPAGPELGFRQPRPRPSTPGPAPAPRRQTQVTSWRPPNPRHPGAAATGAHPPWDYLGLSRRISAADAAILEAPSPRRRRVSCQSPTNGGGGGRQAGRPKPRSGRAALVRRSQWG